MPLSAHERRRLDYLHAMQPEAHRKDLMGSHYAPLSAEEREAAVEAWAGTLEGSAVTRKRPLAPFSGLEPTSGPQRPRASTADGQTEARQDSSKSNLFNTRRQ